MKSVVLGYVISTVGMYRNNKIGTKQGGKNWYLLDIKLLSSFSPRQLPHKNR